MGNSGAWKVHEGYQKQRGVDFQIFYDITLIRQEFFSFYGLSVIQFPKMLRLKILSRHHFYQDFWRAAGVNDTDF